MLYSTLSPCDMCSGTALLYRIPRIVIGENRTFQGPEDYIRSRGVNSRSSTMMNVIELMQEFIALRTGIVERRHRRGVIERIPRPKGLGYIAQPFRLGDPPANYNRHGGSPVQTRRYRVIPPPRLTRTSTNAPQFGQ